MRYALVNNKRVEATHALSALCPGCEQPMVAKCGDRRVHHWAHRGRRTCDHWWEPETRWHRQWKSRFPADWQEFVHVAADGERHIADVRTGHGLVLEFQHSHLRPDERAAREAFYPNLIWVVDGTRLKRDAPRFAAGGQMLRPTPWRGIYTLAFPGECFPPNWIDCRAPAFFDFAGAEPVAPDATPIERYLWGLLPGRAEGHGVVVALGRGGLVRAAHERPQILDTAQIVGVLQARFRAARVAAMQEVRRLPSGKRWKRRRVWRRPRPRRRF